MAMAPGTAGPGGFFAKRKWIPLLILALLGLAGGWLSAHRIFQVDEVQTMHMAWLLTLPDAADFANSAEIYMVPMGLLSRVFEDPFDYMVACRLIFYGIFLVGCVILVSAVVGAGSIALSAGLCLLGTMPVLWDYGFEVRHDTLIVLGLSMLIWMLMKGRPQAPVRRLFAAGVVCGFLFFSSFKSVVIWAPILILLVLSVASGRRAFWIRSLASLTGGLVVSMISAFVLHALMGSLSLYVSSLRSVVTSAGNPDIRFFDWSYALRFVRHHPWLIAVGGFYLVLEGPAISKSISGAVAGKGLDSRIKVMALLLLGPAFLAFNPTPFPYNYVYLVVLSFPAMYIMTARLLTQSLIRPPIILTTLIIVQAATAVPQMSRHFGYLNTHQLAAQAYLDAYTRPEDCVFDGAGLAMFRRGPGRMWYLHSLSQPDYEAGRLTPVRTMLADSGCPILLKSYKWNFMQPEDLAFIRSQYVPFHGALWILGSRIPIIEGSGHFTTFRDGYYLICSYDMVPVRDVRVDGEKTGSQAVFLSKGDHQLDGGAPDAAFFVLWVKDSHFLPPPVPELYSPIFVNWY